MPLRSHSLSVVTACMLCLTWLAGCSVQRCYQGLLVVNDAAAGSGESRLKKITRPPSRSPVNFTVAARVHTADLYLPAEGRPAAGIVLVPGAVPEGKDHEALVAFATTLARARFAVLTPELSGYRDLKIRPAHIREIADAFAYLSSREDLSPGGRAGIGAFSYAVGPSILAALEEDVRTRVRFVLGVGGYYDLRTAIRYFTTGYFSDEGKLKHHTPTEYGKLVFARSVQDHLTNPRDRAILESIVDARLRELPVDTSALAADFGPEGATVYRLLTNTDPHRSEQLISALPAASIATIDALSLRNKDLARLTARLILVHGRNDPLIPYPESLALAGAVESSQARVFIINRILGHVDLRPSGILSWRFWGEELPDALRMLRATMLLLHEREARPAPREIELPARAKIPAVPHAATTTGNIAYDWIDAGQYRWRQPV